MNTPTQPDERDPGRPFPDGPTGLRLVGQDPAPPGRSNRGTASATPAPDGPWIPKDPSADLTSNDRLPARLPAAKTRGGPDSSTKLD